MCIYIYVYPLPYYPILFGASAHGLAGAHSTFASLELLVGGTAQQAVQPCVELIIMLQLYNSALQPNSRHSLK